MKITEQLLKDAGWHDAGSMGDSVFGAEYASGMSVVVHEIPGYAGYASGAASFNVVGEFEWDIPLEEMLRDPSPKAMWEIGRVLVAKGYDDEDVMGAFPEAE